jgi:hypothetical protein
VLNTPLKLAAVVGDREQISSRPFGQIEPIFNYILAGVFENGELGASATFPVMAVVGNESTAPSRI